MTYSKSVFHSLQNWPVSGFLAAAESLLLKSLEKKPVFCSVGGFTGSGGVGVSEGMDWLTPTGVTPPEADSLGDIVDRWRVGMDNDFGTRSQSRLNLQIQTLLWKLNVK